jgi:predicted acyl esterase
MELSYAGNVELGKQAALPSFDELHLRWYDRWLRGVDNGLDAEAPLRIFVMGGGSGRRSGAGRLVHGGRWRDEREWPLARTRFTDFYLHGDGSLGAERPREERSSTTYRFDPASPVPSIGGNVSSLRDVLPLPAGIADPSHAGSGQRTSDIMSPGGFDQREGPAFHGCRPPYLPLGSRPDVLVFETEPLQEPTEVTGPIEVVLWVATSAVDTDFTAKLIDVYPPSPWFPLGYALNLTDSIARLRYRNGRERGERGGGDKDARIVHAGLPVVANVSSEKAICGESDSPVLVRLRPRRGRFRPACAPQCSAHAPPRSSRAPPRHTPAGDAAAACILRTRRRPR